MPRSAATVIVASALAIFPFSVSAEIVMKRLSCKDANPNNQQGILIYHNASLNTQSPTFQVTRDGCRPRNDGGFFSVSNTDFSGTVSGQTFSFTRLGRFTTALQRPVPAGGFARVRFSAASDARISGTFDLKIIPD